MAFTIARSHILYLVIHVTTVATPTLPQWAALRNRVVQDAIMWKAILQASTNLNTQASFHKFSQGVGQVNRYCLVRLDFDNQHKDTLLATLNAEATARSITGTLEQRVSGVLQAELREAALALGYTQTQANQIAIDRLEIETLTSDADWQALKQRVQTYLQNNSAIWYAE